MMTKLKTIVTCVYVNLKVYHRIAKKNYWTIRKESNTYIINNNSIEIIEDKEIRVNGKIVNLRNIENNLF